MCLRPERCSVGRVIREDQDALTQLLQLGLVVLVSDSRAEVVGVGWGMSPQSRPHTPSAGLTGQTKVG